MTVPVIIDCDPGTDDVAALLLARRLDALDVVAVTTVAGNVDVEQGTRNALDLLGLLEWEVPVARGASRPLAGGLVTARDTHGPGGLLGVELPRSTRAADPRPAWEVMHDAALASPTPVEVVAIGPLTNVAVALETYPDLAARISRVVVMGGAVNAGRTMPATEFNSSTDPDAAHRVFTSGVPFWLCPLDVTRQAYVTPDEVARVRALGSPPAVLFADVVDRMFPVVSGDADGRGTPLHDPLAILYAADDAAFTTTACFVDVETQGVQRGRTITDRRADPRREHHGHLVETVDRDAFVATVLAVLGRY